MKPEELRYTKDHEWASAPVDGVCRIGISDHAQKELGDIVYVEESEEGREVEAGDAVSTVESVKAASDIYAPLSGTIKAFNAALSDNSALVNEDPLGEGYILELSGVSQSDWESLMDFTAYQTFLDEA